jgi:hypothetical protein
LSYPLSTVNAIIPLASLVCVSVIIFSAVCMSLALSSVSLLPAQPKERFVNFVFFIFMAKMFCPSWSVFFIQ